MLAAAVSGVLSAFLLGIPALDPVPFGGAVTLFVYRRGRLLRTDASRDGSRSRHLWTVRVTAGLRQSLDARR